MAHSYNFIFAWIWWLWSVSWNSVRAGRIHAYTPASSSVLKYSRNSINARSSFHPADATLVERKWGQYLQWPAEGRRWPAFSPSWRRENGKSRCAKIWRIHGPASHGSGAWASVVRDVSWTRDVSDSLWGWTAPEDVLRKVSRWRSLL